VKSKKRNRSIPPINENIRYDQVRVISPDGEQWGVMSTDRGQSLAEDQNLDLVLVSSKADPPVCRIMDYGKYRYEQDRKARDAKKRQHQVDVKEVKMRYKIDEHDYNVCVNRAQRFLKDGDKVKATVTFRGREIQHADMAEDLLRRLAGDVEEIGEIQQAPKREGRSMMMMLSPKK